MSTPGTEPQGCLLQRGQSGLPPRHVLRLLHIPADVYLAVGGIALLLAAPWLTAAVGARDARAARALLGPSRAEELQLRVEQLTQTRAGVVDAADAERRRLERDLHDGTQQRLVSLAIRLGMARATRRTRRRRTRSSPRPTMRPRRLSPSSAT